VSDIGPALVLSAWILFVAVVLTRWTYGPLSRRFGHMRAVYFNRKIIHVLAGGVVAVLVPFFNSWVVPTAAALVIALFLYIPHKTGRLLWWFQDPDNTYEVTFAVMWALVVALGWGVLGDWRLGVVPALFMAVGDPATGVVRNLLFKRRTKHWAGNIAMAAVSVPIGWYYLGVAGALAGLLASAVERFELSPIDDNVIVPAISFFFLLLVRTAFPL
jgi:phytol kinase